MKASAPWWLLACGFSDPQRNLLDIGLAFRIQTLALGVNIQSRSSIFNEGFWNFAPSFVLLPKDGCFLTEAGQHTDDNVYGLSSICVKDQIKMGFS